MIGCHSLSAGPRSTVVRRSTNQQRWIAFSQDSPCSMSISQQNRNSMRNSRPKASRRMERELLSAIPLRQCPRALQEIQAFSCCRWALSSAFMPSLSEPIHSWCRARRNLIVELLFNGGDPGDELQDQPRPLGRWCRWGIATSPPRPCLLSFQKTLQAWPASSSASCRQTPCVRKPALRIFSGLKLAGHAL